MSFKRIYMIVLLIALAACQEQLGYEENVRVTNLKANELHKTVWVVSRFQYDNGVLWINVESPWEYGCGFRFDQADKAFAHVFCNDLTINYTISKPGRISISIDDPGPNSCDYNDDYQRALSKAYKYEFQGENLKIYTDDSVISYIICYPLEK